MGSFIAIPLLVYLVVVQWKTFKKTQRIERFLMTQAHRQKIDYIPDDETLTQVRKLTALREKRESELREMGRTGDGRD